MYATTEHEFHEHWRAVDYVCEQIEGLKEHLVTGKVYKHWMKKSKDPKDTAFPEIVAQGYQSKEASDEEVRNDTADFLKSCRDDSIEMYGEEK